MVGATESFGDFFLLIGVSNERNRGTRTATQEKIDPKMLKLMWQKGDKRGGKILSFFLGLEAFCTLCDN